MVEGRDSRPGHGACSLQVETHQGGTRWNPTREQVGMLEMLYGGGMRAPNAQQIEQIAVQLGKYGKIEEKNVFYWFQNHKARERQKQKRSAGGIPTYYAQFSQITPTISARACGEVGEEDHINGGDDAPRKRKCSRWGDERIRNGSNSSCSPPVVPKTLELFPLRPEQ